MIRARLLGMSIEGASRDEAERFLARVGGQELLVLLNEIYTQDGGKRPTSGRRGLFRRRRSDR